MPPERIAPVQFRSQIVETELAKRTDEMHPIGPLAADYLQDYFALLVAELRTVDLTEGEAMLLCDALNGTWFTPGMYGQEVKGDAADAILLNGADEKWNVDRDSFVGKMKGWTPGQQCAIADAIRRWWRLMSVELQPEAIDTLRVVGLIK